MYINSLRAFCVTPVCSFQQRASNDTVMIRCNYCSGWKCCDYTVPQGILFCASNEFINTCGWQHLMKRREKWRGWQKRHTGHSALCTTARPRHPRTLCVYVWYIHMVHWIKKYSMAAGEINQNGVFTMWTCPVYIYHQSCEFVLKPQHTLSTPLQIPHWNNAVKQRQHPSIWISNTQNAGYL